VEVRDFSSRDFHSGERGATLVSEGVMRHHSQD
jgi:hypothetical protein